MISSSEPGNRAVSGLFRAWGNAEPFPPGRETISCGNAAMHLREKRVFSLLIPASVFLVTAHFLARWLPWPLAFPAAVIPALALMHAVPLLWFLRKPLFHWWAVLAGMLVWSFFHPVSPLAWFWIAIGILELTGWAFLDLRTLWQRSNVFRFLLLLTGIATAVFLGIRFHWFAGFMTANAIAAVLCRGTFFPKSRLFGPVITGTGNGKILITIDDGPTADTPEILDLLDEFHAKAHFFLIGEKAGKHPDLVREIHRRGHAIGNHSMTHPHARFWCAGPWRTAREIRRCQETLTAIIGRPPEFFRAPVGHRNFFTHPIARALGLRVMAWNCRGYDAVETDPDKILAKIFPRLHPGSLVLLHQGKPVSLPILRSVLEKAAERTGAML